MMNAFKCLPSDDSGLGHFDLFVDLTLDASVFLQSRSYCTEMDCFICGSNERRRGLRREKTLKMQLAKASDVSNCFF